VAAVWSILEDAGDIGHAGRQPEPLPPTPPAVSTYFKIQRKNTHQTKEGKESPKLASVFYLSHSSDCFCNNSKNIVFILFFILSTSSPSVLFIIPYVLIVTTEEM
jgi:hypothetical protein